MAEAPTSRRLESSMYTMNLLLSETACPFGLSLHPEARAAATLATLRQIASLPGAGDVSAVDLAAAFALLAGDRQTDSAPVTARRATVRQVGQDITGDLSYRGHPTEGDAFGARPWFQAQIEAWGDSTDPRQVAIATTAARELAEVLSTRPGGYEGMAEMLVS